MWLPYFSSSCISHVSHCTQDLHFQKIAANYDVLHQQYADDTQLYVAITKLDMSATVNNLQNCLSAVQLWLSQYGLVINPEKSETVLFSTAQQARASQLLLSGVNVAGCVVPFTNSVKILGVTLDRHLTFNVHVQNVCKSAHYHIRALKPYVHRSHQTWRKLLHAR